MSAVPRKSDSPILVKPSTPVIGAEIEGVDLRRPLNDDEFETIQQALLEWKVLFFRDQEISDEQQLEFGRRFGPLTPAHPIAQGLDEHPEIWERAAAEYTQRYQPDLSIPTSKPPRDYKG